MGVLLDIILIQLVLALWSLYFMYPTTTLAKKLTQKFGSYDKAINTILVIQFIPITIEFLIWAICV